MTSGAIRVVSHHVRAVQVVHDDELAESANPRPSAPGLREDDVAWLLAAVIDALIQHNNTPHLLQFRLQQERAFHCRHRR